MGEQVWWQVKGWQPKQARGVVSVAASMQGLLQPCNHQVGIWSRRCCVLSALQVFAAAC